MCMQVGAKCEGDLFAPALFARATPTLNDALVLCSCGKHRVPVYGLYYIQLDPMTIPM